MKNRNGSIGQWIQKVTLAALFMGLIVPAGIARGAVETEPNDTLGSADEVLAGRGGR